MAKDFLEQEIYVGDIVVCTRLNYRELVKAKILKITEKMVILKLLSKVSWGNDIEFKQFHNQVVKINS